ncbi:hypothetical protein CFOL_v3_17605, partial [Cephalotus follicularis]
WKQIKLPDNDRRAHKQSKVSLVPSTAAFVIKTLKEPERDRKNTKNIKHNGENDVTGSPFKLRLLQMAKVFIGSVKEILSTCVSIGCTVDRKNPKDLPHENCCIFLDNKRDYVDGVRIFHLKYF